jgi:hypothetical protein
MSHLEHGQVKRKIPVQIAFLGVEGDQKYAHRDW